MGVTLTLSALSSLPGRAQSQTQSLNDWRAPEGQGRKGWVSGCLQKEENVDGPRRITPRLAARSPASPLHPGSLRQAAMCNVVSGHSFFFFNSLILFLFYMYVYIFFHILFRSGFLQDIEYSSLCYYTMDLAIYPPNIYIQGASVTPKLPIRPSLTPFLGPLLRPIYPKPLAFRCSPMAENCS